MAKVKTERTHEFMIRVVFDRAVTPSVAKKEAQGSLVGFSDWTEEGCAAWTLKVTALKPIPSPAPISRGPEAHPDDLAVDRFVAAMKAKLAKKRDEGYSGWEDAEQCSMVRLLRLLEGHILKGDPIDVSNIAMMVHQRAMMGLVE
jgi:hypothetical protein